MEKIGEYFALEYIGEHGGYYGMNSKMETENIFHAFLYDTPEQAEEERADDRNLKLVRITITKEDM